MSWRLLDTYCHLAFPPFSGDERASIQKASQSGVDKIIVPTTDAAPAPRAPAPASPFPSLYPAQGVAPTATELPPQHDRGTLQQA
ncbi:TatD family hydrolase, partial [Salmonella enterica]|uniref:TatD family hydrolase n=1 Tax=Salmonella enterica TaxID=28901 RepID=UPI000AEC04D4